MIQPTAMCPPVPMYRNRRQLVPAGIGALSLNQIAGNKTVLLILAAAVVLLIVLRRRSTRRRRARRIIRRVTSY